MESQKLPQYAKAIKSCLIYGKQNQQVMMVMTFPKNQLTYY